MIKWFLALFWHSQYGVISQCLTWDDMITFGRFGWGENVIIIHWSGLQSRNNCTLKQGSAKHFLAMLCITSTYKLNTFIIYLMLQKLFKCASVQKPLFKMCWKLILHHFYKGYRIWTKEGLFHGQDTTTIIYNAKVKQIIGTNKLLIRHSWWFAFLWTSWWTHWSQAYAAVILKLYVHFQNPLNTIAAWALAAKLLSGECHIIPPMRS